MNKSKESSNKAIIDINDSYHHLVQVLKKDAIGNRFMQKGNFESYIEYMIKSHFQSVRNAVDGGTNYGQFALIMAKNISPEGKVLAYEINPETVACVETSILLNDYSNVLKVFPYALGNFNGKGEIMLHEHDSYRSFLSKKDITQQDKEKNVYSNEFSTLNINVVTLDDHVYKQTGTHKVEFIRLDIEGAECEALEGAMNIIQNSPDIVISIEWQKPLISNFITSEIDYYKYSKECLGLLLNEEFRFYEFKVHNQDIKYTELNPYFIIDQDVVEFVASRHDLYIKEEYYDLQ